MRGRRKSRKKGEEKEQIKMLTFGMTPNLSEGHKLSHASALLG